MVSQAHYEEVVAKANNLREIRMNMNNWMPSNKMDSAMYSEPVRKSMLRQGSVLRLVVLGYIVYQVCVLLHGSLPRFAHSADEPVSRTGKVGVQEGGRWDRSSRVRHRVQCRAVYVGMISVVY